MSQRHILARVADVADLLRGVTYDKSQSSMEPLPGLVPVLRATNIGPEVRFDELVFVPASCVNEDQFVRPGDVIIAASSGSRSVVGKAAPVRSVWKGAFGAFCFALRPRVGAIEPLYLSSYLQTSEYRNEASLLAAGVNINNLKRDHLEQMPIPVFPLAEQRRIVEAIESYFTRLDDAVATLERVQRNLKRYRASVLKDAVEGRLVPTEAELARAEGREYEPASTLLERILVERRRSQEAGRRRDTPEPLAPDSSELPKLPEGWCWAMLDSLCDSITDGDHLPPPQAEKGVPFLVIGNVRNGCIDFANTRFVPEAYYNSIDEKRRPLYGDVLYTVTGSFGLPVSVDTHRPFCVQRHIAILRPAANTNRRYLVQALASARVFQQASKGATGTAQKTVALKVLRAIVVPVPPLAEQGRIAEEVDRLLSMERTADAIASDNERRCIRLRQAILKWAFEGRLADQDPTDEPASILLKRIKAERLAAGLAKKTGRASRRTKRSA